VCGTIAFLETSLQCGATSQPTGTSMNSRLFIPAIVVMLLSPKFTLAPGAAIPGAPDLSGDFTTAL
jgi:hypothetical protein